MNLDQFVDWTNKQPQPLLWQPTPAREQYRGQCVQLAAWYTNTVWHLPNIFADAVNWFTATTYSQYYKRVAKTADRNLVPPRGALVVWGASLPNSSRAGHIGICLSAVPGALTFTSYDQNWGGKKAHAVTHNYNNVIGWIVPQSAPASQPVSQGGDEAMPIKNPEFIRNMYRYVAGREAAQSDVDWHMKGTPESLLQGFIGGKDLAVLKTKAALDNMQTTINSQNTTITDLNMKLKSANTTSAEKQKALDEALQKIGHNNADLANSHDTIADLQTKPPIIVSAGTTDVIIGGVTHEVPKPAVKPPGIFTRTLVSILTKFADKKK